MQTLIKKKKRKIRKYKKKFPKKQQSTKSKYELNESAIKTKTLAHCHQIR